MNPQLLILKGKTIKDNSVKKSMHFAIIDQDVEASYPANFICVLPQHMNAASAELSLFARIFRENRLEVAQRLLNEALSTEEDPAVRKEIKIRLTQLVPKQPWRYAQKREN
jgi:predicted negative regulator of RcsB-dependent stress response